MFPCNFVWKLHGIEWTRIVAVRIPCFMYLIVWIALSIHKHAQTHDRLAEFFQSIV